MSAVTYAASVEPILLASSSDDGSGVFALMLFALPFVVAFFVYTVMYKRYRNQDKRYQFETATSVVRTQLQRWDTFSRKHNGQRSSTISGKNDHKPLERLSHSVVREALPEREAQESRQAQEARQAQPARDAQEARQAQPERGDASAG